jgi:cytochrome d ubiquinol oxidase subunit I
MHGLNTLEHQPAKIAAIEGHWENPPGEATPLLLFGLPDMDEERTKYGLEIPALGSLILTHSLDKQVPALKISRKRSAKLDHRFLVVPRHGRDGAADDYPRLHQRLAALSPSALPLSPVPLVCPGWACCLCRAARRLGHHRVGRQPWVSTACAPSTRYRCTAPFR